MKVVYEINTSGLGPDVLLVAERFEFMASLLRSEAAGGHVVSRIGQWSTPDASIRLIEITSEETTTVPTNRANLT